MARLARLFAGGAAVVTSAELRPEKKLGRNVWGNGVAAAARFSRAERKIAMWAP